MRRLRHPVRAIREPFGTAGLIVACIALVLGLGGAAFAAKTALSAKQKKEVEKIAKKFAGKPGAAGAQGPAGSNGSNGTNGAPGANGKSVAVSNTAGGCAEGGITVEVEGSGVKREVCNGEEGLQGESGQDGTFSTEALPSEQTLTGVWSSYIAPAFPTDAHKARAVVPISFPIRVVPAPDIVVWINQEGTAGTTFNPASGTFEPFPPEPLTGEELEETCPGSASSPGAAPGFVCVFTGQSENTGFGNEMFTRPKLGTSPDPSSGVVVPFQAFGEEEGFITGSWAVTAQ